MLTMHTSPLWYRQGWPWFLIALPAAAVIAGAVTLWLAVSTNDGLVVDDYYKQGLAIQKTMERSERAFELGLDARLRVQAEALEVELTARSPEAVPEQIRVTLSRPARVGLDQTIVLAGARGRYAGAHKDLVGGRWDIQIEDEPGTWRLNGTVNLPTDAEIRIASTASKPLD